MQRLQLLKEVLSSWRRCMERGMSNKISLPAIYIEGKSLKSKIEANYLKILIFEECCKCIEGLICSKHSFLFIDTEGTIIKKKVMKN